MNSHEREKLFFSFFFFFSITGFYLFFHMCFRTVPNFAYVQRISRYPCWVKRCVTAQNTAARETTVGGAY